MSLFIDNTFGHTLWSSAQLVTDVQNWLDGTNGNYGLLIKRSTEVGSATALRFASRTHPVPDQRPSMVVTYDPPVGPEI